MSSRMIDSLDRRLMLAAFATLNSNGTLSVVGTSAGEQIIVERSGNSIRARLNNQTMSFAATAVKRIWANAFGGADRIENHTNLKSTLIGGSGNDTLVGGSKEDSLYGEGGNDSLRDSAGTNYFNGGGGADRVLPGNSIASGDLDTSDALDYAGATPGNFYINCIEYNVDIMRAGHAGPIVGEFQFQNNGSAVQIFGTEGNDDMLATCFDNSVDVHGSGGNDRIEANGHDLGVIRTFGDGGNDTLMTYGEDLRTDSALGGSGDDLLIRESAHGISGQGFDGGSGFDRLEVGFVGFEYSFDVTIPPGVEAIQSGPGLNPDRDTFLRVYGNELSNLIEVAANFTTILSGAGNDTIIAGNGKDRIDGEDGNDSIIGNGGDDSITGGAGLDTLRGGRGDDTLAPGSDGDLLDYSDEPAGGFRINYDDYGGQDFTISTPSGGLDLIRVPARNLRFLATPGNDTVGLERNNSVTFVDGSAGNDRVFGGGLSALPDDPFPTLAGGAGNDTLAASEDLYHVVMFAGPGNDTIYDEAGDNFVDGGSGYDLLFLARAIASLYHIGPGVEHFEKTEVGNGTIIGNDLNNRIILHGGATEIRGGGGDDHIVVIPDGGGTNTPIFGDAGNDTLIGHGGDTLDGGSGNDSLVGITGPQTMIGASGNDRLEGGDGEDNLFGGSGNDTLIGGAGRDLLHGQTGNDRIFALDGETDTLDGGAGFDRAQRDNAGVIVDSVNNIELFI